jgi:hypothetical protein
MYFSFLEFEVVVAYCVAGMDSFKLSYQDVSNLLSPKELKSQTSLLGITH